MRKSCLFAVLMTLAWSVQASWYWPFGSEDFEGKRPPRLSKLMQPASLLIDEASDLAAEGKADESVEKYRQALKELDRVEMENPERAKTSEFATLRNKRAYVNAAIDAILLSQVKANAKVVAVSDTTELEQKLAAERRAKAAARNGVPPREQVIAAIGRGDFATAEVVIGEMLKEKPSGALALNLKATLEMQQEKYDAAETTLRQAIQANPNNYSAYYNLAILTLKNDPEAVSAARRFYETGRTRGNGPVNPQLEEMLK